MVTVFDHVKVFSVIIYGLYMLVTKSYAICSALYYDFDYYMKDVPIIIGFFTMMTIIVLGSVMILMLIAWCIWLCVKLIQQ
jgi:hypothetical protein